MARKYTVTEIESFRNPVSGRPPVRVFDVKWDDGTPYLSHAHVWVDQGPAGNSARCTDCQSMAGMSGTCAHVNAVKQWLKKEAALRAREIAKAIE